MAVLLSSPFPSSWLLTGGPRSDDGPPYFLCHLRDTDPAFLSSRVWTACLWMRSLTPPCMCMSPQSTVPTSSSASMTNGKRTSSVMWLWSWRGRSSEPTGPCWPRAANTSGKPWSDRRKMTWWSACLKRYGYLVCFVWLLQEVCWLIKKKKKTGKGGGRSHMRTMPRSCPHDPHVVL